jgi:predicted metal-dependent phosphotriesterase family hydrolase
LPSPQRNRNRRTITKGHLHTRREALKILAGAAAADIVQPSIRVAGASIQTVLGPIPAASLGFTLPHEHVMVDFIGAQKTNRARWNADQVVARMRPFLMAAKQSGVRAFVDCTPAYVGRDPRVLKKLAQDTGLHILTNTGYYGDGKGLYLPASAHSETAVEIASRWLAEWGDGIDDTGIRPGFIKIRVDGEAAERSRMTEMDRKLIGAAAQVSRKTNMAVTCHSPGPSGLAAALFFAAQDGDPSKFIVAHCDDNGADLNRRIAAAGSWVSIDGIGRKPEKDHVPIVMPLLERSPDRLLLSIDSGWYHVGEPDGGKIEGFTALPDRFLPALREAGISSAQIKRITVENPATVFTSSVH